MLNAHNYLIAFFNPQAFVVDITNVIRLIKGLVIIFQNGTPMREQLREKLGHGLINLLLRTSENISKGQHSYRVPYYDTKKSYS